MDVFGAIIAGEKDERFVGETEFIKRFEKTANVLIHIGDRAVEDLRGAFEGEIFADGTQKVVSFHLFLGWIERRMRNEHPGIDIKRLVLVRGYESDGLVHNGSGGFGAEGEVGFVTAAALVSRRTAPLVP